MVYPALLQLMAHGDAREGKWRGNWRMEWVASTLHTTSEHGVSCITTADAHTSADSSRLNWRPPADLNWLVRLAELRFVRVCHHISNAVYNSRNKTAGLGNAKEVFFYKGILYDEKTLSNYGILKEHYLLWIYTETFWIYVTYRGPEESIFHVRR